MSERFIRTEALIGSQGINKLRHTTVAVFGVGGVGSYAVESLARSGIGNLVLIDYDVICESNINRQIHATTKTIGMSKVEAMKNRIEEINPDCNVKVFMEKYSYESNQYLLSKDYDYVIDAIDMISSKIELIVNCKTKDIPIVSSMGAGNKLDPTMFEVEDIYNTSICPLAKIIRKELKKRGICDLKVVYSKEIPKKNRPIGSIAFVPSCAGLILSSVVIKDLLGIDK